MVKQERGHRLTQETIMLHTKPVIWLMVFTAALGALMTAVALVIA